MTIQTHGWREETAADDAAKKVVGYTGVKQMVRMGSEYEKNPGLDKEDIIKEQEKAPPEEKALWRERGAERKKSGGNTERTGCHGETNQSQHIR